MVSIRKAPFWGFKSEFATFLPVQSYPSNHPSCSLLNPTVCVNLPGHFNLKWQGQHTMKSSYYHWVNLQKYLPIPRGTNNNNNKITGETLWLQINVKSCKNAVHCDLVNESLKPVCLPHFLSVCPCHVSMTVVWWTWLVLGFCPVQGMGHSVLMHVGTRSSPTGTANRINWYRKWMDEWSLPGDLEMYLLWEWQAICSYQFFAGPPLVPPCSKKKDVEMPSGLPIKHDKVPSTLPFQWRKRDRVH